MQNFANEEEIYIVIFLSHISRLNNKISLIKDIWYAFAVKLHP